jgi:hypothetical protein
MDLRILKYGNRRKNITLRDNRVVDVVTRTWEAGLSGGSMPELTIRHKPKPTGKVMMLVYYQGEHLEPCIKGWITEREAHIVGREDQFRDGIENIVVSPALLHHPVELLEQHKPESPWIRAHIERQQQLEAQRAAVQVIEDSKPRQEVLL